MQQHKSAAGSFKCGSCRRIFCYENDLQSHQLSSQHCYCNFCNQFFDTAKNLKQHCDAVHTNICRTCGKHFNYAEVLRQHQMANEHCYCKRCKTLLEDEESMKRHKLSKDHLVNLRPQNQHKKSSGDTPELHCCDCDRDFVSEQALKQHSHTTVRKTKSHPCPKCKRVFRSQSALEQHMASLAHKPLSDVKCVASSDCNCRFSSPSALIQHLEGGKCCSGMTREKLNELVRSNDVDRVISAGPQEKELISSAPHDSISDSDSDSNDGVPIYTPISTGSLTPILKPTIHEMLNTLLSENTFSESLSGLLDPQSGIDLSDRTRIPTITSLFCPLCPPTRKAFISTEALAMHLASPKHAPKAFHCPKDLSLPPSAANEKQNPAAAPIKSFSTLSGMTQHLESGACKGGKAGLKAAVKLLEKRLLEIGFKHQGLLKI
ncbi:hypothetical protein MMC29_005050 [Sticta canariensis]|nr:hypothetical protein [Sticta canariensis]